MLAIVASALSVASPSLNRLASETEMPRLGPLVSKPPSRWNEAEFCQAEAGNSAEGIFFRSSSIEHVLVNDVIADRRAVQRAQDVACGLFAHPVDGFPCHARHVRGD